MTLISDLISRIMSGAYPILFEVGIPWCVDMSFGCGVSCAILCHCDIALHL